MPRLLIEEPQSVASMPRTNPAAYGAGVGQAMDTTGRLAQAFSQVVAEWSESESRSAAVRYEQDLKAGAMQISADPDIAGRMEKLDTLERRLQDAHRPTLGSRNEYESRVSFAANDVRTNLMAKTATDATNEVRLNAELEANYRIQSAAASGDEREIETAFVEAQRAFADASLAYTPAEQTVAFQKTVGLGIRTLAGTHPEQALKYIDRLGPMLGPEVQGVYRDEAMAAIQRNVSAEYTRRQQERTLREQDESDRNDAAEDRFAQADARHELTTTMIEAAVIRGEVTADVGRLWLDRARSGPVGSTGTGDKGVYISLRTRSDNGENVMKETNEAYRIGAITKDDRDSIINTSRNVRFKGPRDYIRTALDPRANASDGDASTKMAQAFMYFDDWARAHPDASLEQAQDVAMRQVEGAKAAYTNRERPTELVRPVGVVNVKDSERSNVVDIDASKRELNRRRRLPDDDPEKLPEFEYGQEMLKLKRIADAYDRQEDAARKRAAKTAGADQ